RVSAGANIFRYALAPDSSISLAWQANAHGIRKYRTAVRQRELRSGEPRFVLRARNGCRGDDELRGCRRAFGVYGMDADRLESTKMGLYSRRVRRSTAGGAMANSPLHRSILIRLAQHADGRV